MRSKFTTDVPAYIAAHSESIANREQIEESVVCGCFHCSSVFGPNEIDNWIDDRDGETAICPCCWVDAVIGDASGYPITEEFLDLMGRYWF